MKQNKQDNFIDCRTLLNRDRVLVQTKTIKFENYITNKSNTIIFISKDLVFE
jgi:hypothetical protein